MSRDTGSRWVLGATVGSKGRTERADTGSQEAGGRSYRMAGFVSLPRVTVRDN